MPRRDRHRITASAITAIVIGLWTIGCEKKEKILDIETPSGGVQIEKTGDGVEIDVEKSKRKDSGGTRIRIETDGKND